MVNKAKTLALSATALTVLSANPAAAQLLKTGPSIFNYNDVNAVFIDDDIGNGLGLRFSANIRENYSLQVEYTRLTAGRLDSDVISGGVAYHIAANQFPDKADWVFNLGFQIVDVESDDETGLAAGAGIRYAVNDKIEVNGSLNLTTAFDTDLTVNLAAFYELSSGFNAFVETDIGDGTALGIGARFYWR